jgi:hypothetical protein
MQTYNTRTMTASTTALAALTLGSCLLAGQAMAVGAVAQKNQPGAAESAGVVKHGNMLIRPLFSPTCLYKPVMSNEDMSRCGISLTQAPQPVMTRTAFRADRGYRREPDPGEIRIDLRTVHAYRQEPDPGEIRIDLRTVRAYR